jgi:acetylglutamate kinase
LKQIIKPIVVKIGGSTLGKHDTTITDLIELQKRGRQVIVVHGGGKIITDWLAKQNVKANFVRGERVTDLPTLEVATAVLTGLVNKEITASINISGGRAVGICGTDGGLIRSVIKNAELGYVGNVVAVDLSLLLSLLQTGFIPVIATVGLNVSGRSEEPKVLNINADAVAGEIAAAICAEKLIFLTDVDGIHDKSGEVLAKLTVFEAESLIHSGVAAGGMIPKIKACIKALSANAVTCIIDGRQPHALLNDIEGKITGTVIIRS